MAVRIEYEGIVEQQPTYSHVGYFSAANARIVNGESDFPLAAGLATTALVFALVAARLVGRGSRKGGIVVGVLALVAAGGVIALGLKPFQPASYEAITPNITTYWRLQDHAFQVESYRDRHGAFPSELPLREHDKDARRSLGIWNTNRDAWGREFRYTVTGESDDQSFEVRSAGADGKFGTPDDLFNGMDKDALDMDRAWGKDHRWR